MQLRFLQNLALIGCGAIGAIALVQMVPHAFALQPSMQSALDNLQDAERDLENATNDKGGHRQKALRLVRQAETEVRAGMRFDRRN